MSQSDGIVVRGGAQGFVQEITAGRHPLIADEPVAVGGTERAKQRARLLEAGEKCPVHRTLKSEIDIRTTTQPSAE